MGAQGYVVVLDGNGNEVDVLNIDNSSHYSQQCHDFLYDTTFDSSAQNKDIYRDPDGIGDWYDVGSGANSGGSRCINREGDSGLLFTRFDAIDIDENMPTKITGSESVPIKTKVVNQPFDLNVITSYSIHYTKLYDITFKILNRNQCFFNTCRICSNKLFFQTSNWKYSAC